MNAEIPKMCPHEMPYEECPSIACKTRLRAFAAPTGLAGGLIQPLLEPLKAETKKLLTIMGNLDPNAGPERNADWPLQLRGDEKETGELCDCLNRLQELVKA